MLALLRREGVVIASVILLLELLALALPIVALAHGWDGQPDIDPVPAGLAAGGAAAAAGALMRRQGRPPKGPKMFTVKRPGRKPAPARKAPAETPPETNSASTARGDGVPFGPRGPEARPDNKLDDFDQQQAEKDSFTRGPSDRAKNIGKGSKDFRGK